MLQIKIDRAKVEEKLARARNNIEQNRREFEPATEEVLKRAAYSVIWLSDHVQLCFYEYALTRNAAQLRANVLRWVEQHLPYFKYSAKYREEALGRRGFPYDKGGLADFDFALPFCLFVIVASRDEVLPLCEETNYGPYGGKERVNSHMGIVCRMIRAFYLNDEAWLKGEIESLKTCRVCRDFGDQISFHIPKARWHPLFDSLFFGDRQTFQVHAKYVSKWYQSTVRKKMMFEDGTIAVAAIINVLLLMVLKIANVFRGYDVRIEDEFLPYEIINPA